jgi:hypothetical protein
MKIVLLDGGFANQMTQYIFARCLQEESNEPVFLDDLFFHVRCTENAESVIMPVDKGHYQLDKFPNINKIPLMSEYFDKDVWENIVRCSTEMGAIDGGSWLPQILKNNGLNFFMIAEAPIYRFDGMVARMPYYHYIPEMLKAQGNAYYFGWFTNGGWFMSHEKMFRHELSLPAFMSKTDLEMAFEIERSKSVGVHIRCSGGYKAHGIAYPPEYYKKQIGSICEHIKSNKKLRSDIKPPHFFVFSDDIAWCKNNIKQLGLKDLPYPVTFGQPDRGPDDNQNDMKLLSMCDILLLNNSVYGYMAALLNEKPQKIVINPVKSRGVF